MTLQKQFRGLSDLLGLYEAGQLKLDLIRGIQPSVDVTKFSAQPQWETDQDTVPAAGAGTFLEIGSVPSNEVRIVWRMGAASPAPVPAANSVILAERLVLENGARQAGLAPAIGSSFALYTAGDYVNQGITFADGFWLFPGDQLGYFVRNKTGGSTIVITTAYQYSKFLI